MEPSVTYMGFVIDAEGTHLTGRKGACAQGSTNPAEQERAPIILGSPEFLQEVHPQPFDYGRAAQPTTARQHSFRLD